MALLATIALALPGTALAGKKSKKKDADVVIAFTMQQRDSVRVYFVEKHGRGHCPPGLAKKNNGCMPPGQAKKWGMGRPLPGDLRYYDLPRDLLMRLPPPPAGHRYVRVAADILLIAVGSSMVIDALEDLVR